MRKIVKKSNLLGSSLPSLNLVFWIIIVEQISCNYMFDGNNPFNLTTKNRTISAIASNYEGNWLAAFSDDKIISYDGQFLNAFQIPTFLNGGNHVRTIQYYKSVNVYWGNFFLGGTNTTNQMILILGTSLRTVYVLQYYDFSLLSVQTFNQNIVHYYLYPYQLVGIDLNFGLVFTTNKIYYLNINIQGLIQTTSFNMSCGLTWESTLTIVNSVDFSISSQHYLGLTNGTILSYRKQMPFFVNYSSPYIYVYAYSSNISSIKTSMYSHNGSVTKILKLSNTCFISQGILNDIKGFDANFSTVVQIDPLLQGKPLTQIYTLNNSLYFLYQNQSIEVIYDQVYFWINATLDRESIATTPNNSNSPLVVVGLNFALFYFKQTQNIYQIDECLGSMNYISANNSCVSFNCSMLACQSCTLESNLCDICVDGYLRNESNFNKCDKNICSDTYCNLCFNNQTCISCLNGYERSSNMTACILCNIGSCISCNSPDTCYSCALSYILFNNSCIMCMLSNCVMCSSGNICSNCASNFSLINNNCILCNIPFCVLCFGANICNSCVVNYSLINNSCISCNIASCLSCETSNVCVSCSSNYSLFQNACVSCSISFCILCKSNETCSNCLLNYDLIDNICILCSIEFCLECHSNNICLKCVQNYTLSNNSCLLIHLIPIAQSYDLIDFLISCNFLNNETSTLDQIQQCQTYLRNDVMLNAIIINKYLASTPYVQQLVTIMSPFFSFMNDYWYYIYHNRSYDELFVTKIFLEVIYVINNQKVIPYFLETENQIQNYLLNAYQSKFKTKTYINYTTTKVYAIDQQETYFTLNIFGMMLWNYTFVAVIFGLLKLLKRLFELLFKFREDYTSHKRPQGIQLIKAKIYYFLCSKSAFCCLLVALFENNSMFISFYGTLQLKQLFQFTIYDKVNLVLCLLFGFICLFMSCTFYFLLFSFKTSYRRSLNQEKINTQAAYIQTTYLIGIRNVFYGAIQAYFINDYLKNICSLLILKVILVILIIKYRKCYKKSVIMLMTACYFIAGLGYDFLLLLTYLSFNGYLSFLQTFWISYSIYFELTFIVVFIASICIQILYYALFGIFYAVKNLAAFIKNSKIANSNTQPEVKKNKQKIKPSKNSVIFVDNAIQQQENNSPAQNKYIISFKTSSKLTNSNKRKHTHFKQNIQKSLQQKSNLREEKKFKTTKPKRQVTFKNTIRERKIQKLCLNVVLAKDQIQISRKNMQLEFNYEKKQNGRNKEEYKHKKDEGKNQLKGKMIQLKRARFKILIE